MSDHGLLFVFGEVGADASVEEFNDWYDNEHGPARLTVPGFSNAIRYKASDGEAPSWLALYDLASTSVAYSDAYKALAAQGSTREKALIPRLATLNRRIYDLLSAKTSPSFLTTSPAKYIFVVTKSIHPELEEDYNRFYEEEHTEEVSKTPGWLRTRRYKLVDHVELSGKADSLSLGNEVHNYLVIHEWDNDNYLATPEFEASISTAWAKKVLGSVRAASKRSFVLYKNIQKLEL